MRGEQLAQIRKANGWTQKQLAEMLSSALGKSYASNRVGEWERDRVKIPAHIETFVTELGLSTILTDDRTSDAEPRPFPPAEGEPVLDSHPPTPDDQQPRLLPQEPLTSSSGAYSRVCQEMWELVATAVGMVGAVTGNERLQQDGVIIDADKEALGKAYGKLAETNETFRRMLTGMTASGAWLEVSLVTGITAGKVMRNHQRAKPLPEQPEEGDDDGGSLFAFPASG